MALRACLISRLRRIFEHFFSRQESFFDAKPKLLLEKAAEGWWKISQKDGAMEILNRLLYREGSFCYCILCHIDLKLSNCTIHKIYKIARKY